MLKIILQPLRNTPFAELLFAHARHSHNVVTVEHNGGAVGKLCHDLCYLRRRCSHFIYGGVFLENDLSVRACVYFQGVAFTYNSYTVINQRI